MGPVLNLSNRLTESDLIDVAKFKGQAHLLAISGRGFVSETLPTYLSSKELRNSTMRLREILAPDFAGEKVCEGQKIVESLVLGPILGCAC